MVIASNKTDESSQIEQVYRQKAQPYHPPIEENNSDIITLINEEHIMTYVSPSITSILGYAPHLCDCIAYSTTRRKNITPVLAHLWIRCSLAQLG